MIGAVCPVVSGECAPALIDSDDGSVSVEQGDGHGQGIKDALGGGDKGCGLELWLRLHGECAWAGAARSKLR